MCGARSAHHPARDEAFAPPAGSTPEAPARSMTIPDDRLRASDAEREAAAAELQVHAAAGRLEVEELDERMTAVLAARTRADIAGALGDLPEAPRTSSRPTTRDARRPGAYLAVMVLLVGIWLLTGAGHFWPLYPALGWGLPLLLHARRAAVAPASLTP